MRLRPEDGHGVGPGDPGRAGREHDPSALPRSASPSAAPSQAAALNGTAGNGLTISNGTRYVVENGTVVDFGTAVRDLAWSYDGRKAVFVDGDGDLVTSNPDGSGRVVVARNPGGQTWSHPTWQYRAKDPRDGYNADMNAILFAVRPNGGTSRLYGIDARAVNGVPRLLGLDAESGPNVKPLPQTGNSWPSAGVRTAPRCTRTPATATSTSATTTCASRAAR
ncbi:hypothetical protein ACFQZC_27300 [Streptacidiphilus monticola]